MLAFLPSLCGSPVRNSIVVAPFVGKYASRALRIGVLPAPTADESRALASTTLASLSRLPASDSVSVAVYRDEPFADVAPVWVAAFEVLLERFHQSGYEIKDAGIVASDGWMPFFEGDAESPLPLSEIAEAAQGLPQDLDRDDTPRVPEPDPAVADRVERILTERLLYDCERDAFGRLRPAPALDPIDLLEHALTHSPANASALTIARLIDVMDSEGAVDRTVLQIAFGRVTGASSWSRTLEMRSAAAEAGCEPSDLLLEAHDRGDVDAISERLSGLLMGQTHEMPSRERLRSGALLLGRALAHCPPSEKAWLMCAFAWVQWALGLTTAAIGTITSARHLYPQNTLAPIYHTEFEHFMPDWLFSDYRPPRAERRRASKKRM